MNESPFQSLLEEFQDGALSEDDCRELLEWLDGDETRLSAFADELRLGNALAALHLLDSDLVAFSVKDSLVRSGTPIDVSQHVRQQIESRRRGSTDRTKQSKGLSRRRTS